MPTFVKILLVSIPFPLLVLLYSYVSPMYYDYLDLQRVTIHQQNLIETLHNKIHKLNQDIHVPLYSSDGEFKDDLIFVDVTAIEKRTKDVLKSRDWKFDSAYIAARECSFIIKSELTDKGVPFQ